MGKVYWYDQDGVAIVSNSILWPLYLMSAHRKYMVGENEIRKRLKRGKEKSGLAQ